MRSCINQLSVSLKTILLKHNLEKATFQLPTSCALILGLLYYIWLHCLSDGRVIRVLWCSPRYKVHSSIDFLPHQDLKKKMNNNTFKYCLHFSLAVRELQSLGKLQVPVKSSSEDKLKSDILGSGLGSDSSLLLACCLILISLCLSFLIDKMGLKTILPV